MPACCLSSTHSCRQEAAGFSCQLCHMGVKALGPLTSGLSPAMSLATSFSTSSAITAPSFLTIVPIHTALTRYGHTCFQCIAVNLERHECFLVAYMVSVGVSLRIAQLALVTPSQQHNLHCQSFVIPQVLVLATPAGCAGISFKS